MSLPLHRLPAAGWAVTGLAVLACGRRRPLHGARIAGSLALAGTAGWLGVGALRQFHERGTTHSPIAIHRASSLVQDGVYAVSRNPMYAALVASLGALALARGRALGSLPVAGYAAWLQAGQIAREEHALTEIFGEEYIAYTRRVRRWIGWRRQPPHAH